MFCNVLDTPIPMSRKIYLFLSIACSVEVYFILRKDQKLLWAGPLLNLIKIYQ